MSEQTTSERVKLGWDWQDSEPWILRIGENAADRSKFWQWWAESDVVICGERRLARFAERLQAGKLTFYMSERWWKPPIGMARLLDPRFAQMALRFRWLAQSSQFHYLSNGAYAATDMRRLSSFPGRMWNWGYFTSVPDPLPPCLKREGPIQILWAGRMLAWKRVDTLLRAFALLLRQATNARLTLIGDGPHRGKLERLAQKLEIVGGLDWSSSIPATQVRTRMRNAHVYVLPSSAYEGWGAVLNEAMSEGCAVVASEETGSAKTMLRHDENGFLFRAGSHRQLAGLLVKLHDDEALRQRLAKAGQSTISKCWSPSLASQRLLAVSNALLSRLQLPDYPSGPMTQSTD
ncbi:MAG: glycosyltransferase [Verrucomicrobiota bacterium]